MYGGAGNYNVPTREQAWGQDDDDDDDDDDLPGLEAEKPSPAPEAATFEKLRDGSTALVMAAGWRLKLCLEDLDVGGDAKKVRVPTCVCAWVHMRGSAGPCVCV